MILYQILSFLFSRSILIIGHLKNHWKEQPFITVVRVSMLVGQLGHIFTDTFARIARAINVKQTRELQTRAYLRFLPGGRTLRIIILNWVDQFKTRGTISQPKRQRILESTCQRLFIQLEKIRNSRSGVYPTNTK